LRTVAELVTRIAGVSFADIPPQRGSNPARAVAKASKIVGAPSSSPYLAVVVLTWPHRQKLPLSKWKGLSVLRLNRQKLPNASMTMNPESN
jgi:hypothetical protein